MAPLCFGDTVREGWSSGWARPGPVHPLTAYGTWYLAVPPGSTRVHVNVSHSLRFEAYDEARRVLGPDVEWCTRARARGMESVQVRRAHLSRTELVMCDDTSVRQPVLGACTHALRTIGDNGSSTCTCSDSYNIANCDEVPNDWTLPQTCDEARAWITRLMWRACADRRSRRSTDTCSPSLNGHVL